MIRQPTLLLLLVAVCGPATGEVVHPALHSISGAQYHEITSQNADRVYQIFVHAPPDNKGNRKYPTIYLLDGGLTFPLLTSLQHYLRLGDEMEPMVTVGISYGTDDWQKGNNRSTDFTAPAKGRDHWGGASAFQGALADELIPFIEETYPADPDRRIVFGQSLGGQFVLYTAQTRPDLFWGHIASNPALHRNLDFFLINPQPTRKTRSRLFVAVGSNDLPEFKNPMRTWEEHWSAVEDPPWKLAIVELEGETHFSAAPAAFRRGIAWLLD